MSGLAQGLWTLALIVIFAGIVVWAWSGRRKRDFDDAANLPFKHDDAPPTGNTRREDKP